MRQLSKCLSLSKQLRQIIWLRACIVHRHLCKPQFGKPVGHKVNRQQLPWRKSKPNMPSLSSGQSGLRQGCKSCNPSHQQVSWAVFFLNSEANRQQCRMYLTGSVKDTSSNKRKNHTCFFTAQRKLIEHSTAVATYTISSTPHPQDQ